MSHDGSNTAEQMIRICARAGQPARAAAFIASGATPSKAEAVLKREAAARVRTASAGPASAVASMQRVLKAQGIEPKADHGAGLPPAQAFMARLVARTGR